jgi:hypothetical protein
VDNVLRIAAVGQPGSHEAAIEAVVLEGLLAALAALAGVHARLDAGSVADAPAFDAVADGPAVGCESWAKEFEMETYTTMPAPSWPGHSDLPGRPRSPIRLCTSDIWSDMS